MTEFVLVLLTSFTLTFLMMPLFIKYLSKKEILDIPGGRKIHRGAKPSLGGIPMFISFIAAILIWLPLSSWHIIKFTLLAQTLLFIIGVRDDLLPMRAWHKLIGQLLAVSIIIFIADIRIKSLNGFLNIYELPFTISVAITYIVIIGITNAFNLIDGLDGLAGTISLIAFSALGGWFYLTSHPIEALISFSVVGAVLGFLIFNWQPSLIFMGDTGSLFIGLTIALLIIQFLGFNSVLAADFVFQFKCPLALAISSIIVPVTDTSRIIILRLSKGHSPFKPDKNHIHHAIMRLGMTHEKAVIIMGSFQAMCILIVFLLRRQPDWVPLTIILTLSIACSIVLDRLIISKTKRSS
jgi:UDP-GlcNAc:undecaprenyl-phosphate GlcNAc-1-phosphate transferase